MPASKVQVHPLVVIRVKYVAQLPMEISLMTLSVFRIVNPALHNCPSRIICSFMILSCCFKNTSRQERRVPFPSALHVKCPACMD